MNWWKNLKGRVRLAEPLKKYTTFKIGGPAAFFVEPRDADDLKLLITLAKRCHLPIFVIGAGSNLLVSDKGIKGVVVRLNAPYFNRLSRKDNYLEAGSGVWLGRVLFFARKYGLSGAEFLSGIPGTVGGALAMNAGVAKDNRSIMELVKSVTVMDYRGNKRVLKKKDIRSGYRTSSLSKYIILSAILELRKGGRREVDNKIKRYLEYRKLSQDLSRPSAGCIFKNPPGDSAGRLIDSCGLKGKRAKGAGVSLKHANFILNLGRASSRDVIKLMGLINKEVKNKFRISLAPEIKIWKG